MRRSKANRIARDDLGVGDGHDAGDALADDREGALAGRVELLAVGDRAADRDADALAGGERAGRVVADLRLDADRRGSRGTARSAAVAEPAISPPPPTGTSSRSSDAAVLDQLERRGALAGHDPLVVVGVDDREPVALGELGEQRLAVAAVAVEAHDPRAVALGGGGLRRGRVLGVDATRRATAGTGGRTTAFATVHTVPVAMTSIDSLTRYRLLGRTGLRVSPMALGAMTFGGRVERHADGEPARMPRAPSLDRYVEAGGNFVDTAVNYAGGRE